MSNMELRSSRSRSKTPFLTQDFINNEVIESGNHVEKTVVRSTRRTTVYKTSEGATSSTTEEYHSKPIKKSASRSERSLRSRLLKTSDYSSEEGENEVSSTKTISQNEKNQMLENARSAANGSDMPALELYKKSGRYWEVYPKTDWTYSYHSKDRVEIAPGVVAMPNMSRKTIHALDESSGDKLYSENVSHKSVSTETTYLARNRSGTTEDIKKNLFNNNQEDYYIKRRSSTRWSSFKTTIITVLTSVVTVFYYAYKVQTNWLSRIHNLAGRVMLLDTWLLWKTRPANKVSNLAKLCLIPLLLLGGWWMLSGLGSILYTALSNYTIPATNLPDGKPLLDRHETGASNLVKTSEKIIKINNEIAGVLSDVNADKNSRIDVDDLVQKIVENPQFHTVINNYYKKEVKASSDDLFDRHQVLIDTLVKEINNMKRDMLLTEKMRRQEQAKLSFEIKRCCQKPVVNVESYVTRVVTDLLNNPEFLQSQRGLNDWLESLFVAKQVLEYRLGNITLDVDSKTADLVQENSKILMDKVAANLLEIKKQNLNYVRNDYTGSVDENQIQKIVHNALVIYDADKTGLVDYAMETMGGQIVTTRCTENYQHGKAVVSVLGIPLWYPVNSPRTVITPSINPGECWAFQNFPGFIVIKLSNKIKVEAFSLEHISKLLVPEGKIDSAPKEFEVYGLTRENDNEPVKLGTYVYDYDGESLQFFAVEVENRVFSMIEVRILSNHGNPNYTCLYRFRVHGKLHHDDEAS